MNKIKSYSDLKKYLKSKPLKVCWYGPKSSDILEMGEILNISAILSCYGLGINKNYPMLINELSGKRQKCSVDSLAKIFIEKKVLYSFIKKNNIQTILPYDTNPELEKFCKENNIDLLSAPDSIKDILRDKTKIDDISRSVGLSTIPGIPGIIDNFEFETLVRKFGLPLFLHFAEGAGGSGNRIVNSKIDFERVKKEQKGKKLNAKKYFVGKTCTIDVCVTKNSIICGTLEEELIGAYPLNSNSTEYVGSSWFENNYSIEIRRRISNTGVLLGEFARSKGFVGCFHPDFLIGPNNEIYITELNMRFGGSCGAYSKIQVAEKQIPMYVIQALAFENPEIVFDQNKINTENLKPINYGFLVFKNNFGKSIKISKNFKSGLYSLSKKAIKFIGDCEFKDFKKKNTILISGLPNTNKDTSVEEGAYICEIMTRFPISDSKSNLNKEGEILVKKIFSQFIF